MPDEPLTWRTYRNQAPVPVLRAQTRRSYRLESRLDPEEEDLEVPAYEEASGAYSGTVWESGDHLPSRALGREPVLIRTPNSENYTTKWRWAEPQRERADLYTGYDQPALLPEQGALLVPEYRRRSAEEKPTYRQARSRGNGIFSIDPGFRGLQGVLVDGDSTGFSYDYDPRHGALYIEESWGSPMPADVNVEVFVRRSDSMRVDLQQVDPGEHPVTVGIPPETISILHVQRKRRMVDARRLPQPDQSEKWHAVDYAQYDGRPIPEGMMWVIHTNASPEDVADATDRVMPSGTLYRTKKITPEISSITSDTEGDLTKTDWTTR